MRDWLARLAARRRRPRRGGPADRSTARSPRCDRAVDALAAAADEQATARERARRAGPTRPTEARADRRAGASHDGALLRGEVLARWQEFVGTGEFMRALQARVGRLRDRLVAARHRPAAARRRAAQSARVAARRRCSRARRRGRRAGRAARGRRIRRARRCSTPALARARRRTCADAPSGWSATGSAACSTWSRDEGGDEALRGPGQRVRGERRPGCVVMIAVFAATAFIPTGAEIAVAGGTTRRGPEGARGDLRRPGRPQPGRRGPGTTCSTGSARCSTRRPPGSAPYGRRRGSTPPAASGRSAVQSAARAAADRRAEPAAASRRRAARSR